MKKLLILAYDFPPYVSVGGLRPYSWYKYMHEFGIFPVVVTRQWSNKYGNHLDYIAPGESNQVIIEESEKGLIIRAPYKPTLANRLMLRYGENRFKFLRKIITGWYEFFQWFLPIGPKYPIYKAAKEFLKTNKVDCIIATGDPFILFRYASLLSKRYKVPWIADYRDPWVKDNSMRIFLKVFYKTLEYRYIKESSKITTVSEYLKFLINTNNKNKISLIYNGFDIDLFKENDTASKNTVLTISFGGTIYKWHPWKSFLEILNSFCNNNRFHINMFFYGINIKNEIEEFVKDARINESKFLKITFFSKMPYEKILFEFNKSDILLLFNDFQIIGTKIFDYLAIQKKILFLFAEDNDMELLKTKNYPYKEIPYYKRCPQVELIKECNAGYIVNDKKHLLSVLEEVKNEFETNGFISCKSHGFEFYSRRNQSKILAEIIKEIIDEK